MMYDQVLARSMKAKNQVPHSGTAAGAGISGTASYIAQAKGPGRPMQSQLQPRESYNLHLL
jgi:hypothetical protein